MELRKNQEPLISVGVMSGVTISFTLNGSFNVDGTSVSGLHSVRLVDGLVEYEGRRFECLDFIPSDGATFSLHDVTIGINFHWQRNETQTFSGSLSIIVDGDKLWAVNRLPIEDYLFCVIASEMSATSSLELLKAHAITSRSWLIAQLQRKNDQSRIELRTGEELVKWYDRDDHHLFDVCADDHCQRYQGLTRVMQSDSSTKILHRAPKCAALVRQAIDETRGMLLISRQPGQAPGGLGEVCDARFSKCCGGVTELYETCWDSTPHRYLQSFPDFTHRPGGLPVDLSIEDNAKAWIESNPDSFCNTQDATILRQVLNSYDQETADFYRWKVEYTTEQLSELVARRTGIDFGRITDLVPLTRGRSGRISRLQIIGDKCSYIIGKELEIRRSLSESHLYSSAFMVHKTTDGFILHGSGWGHGVGLCQIGAAVMSHRGFGFKAILLHYFRAAVIEKWWN
ncbi:MAG: SpoIID/LytB domain-containing protein [Bacteroidales bacterium]|nr:SpoIID/LytB domain-containing protein [Bacteroidales bacterium]